MINRCYSPVDHHFCNYGGRGITVCDEWKSDFMSFFKWAIASGHRDGLAIDRIDNSGNYNPQNCRWVTRSENAQNQRQLRVNNKSGYRGVYFDITRNKWVSAIESKGRKYHLGTFSVPEDAAKAYNDFVLYNKTFHPLNTIQ